VCAEPEYLTANPARAGQDLMIQPQTSEGIRPVGSDRVIPEPPGIRGSFFASFAVQLQRLG